jgi:UDP:flavonoid glycosyltransferase YjiC (YdhE family)
MLAAAAAFPPELHQVYFYANAAFEPAVRALGARFVASTGWAPSAPPAEPDAKAARAEDSLQPVIKGILENIARDAERCSELLREHRIEVVLTDSLCTGAGFAAERSGLPWVTLQTSPWLLTDEATLRFNGDSSPIRARLGLPPTTLPLRRQGISPQMQLLAWAPECDAVPPPSTGVYAGALIADLPASMPERLAELGIHRPLVLVTTTTMPMVMDDFDPGFIAEAFGSIDADVVMTQTREQTAPVLPPNVHAVPFVPHGLLVPRAAVMITHGGWGSVSRALLAGVPTIVVPGRSKYGVAHDTTSNGRLCEKLGVGRIMPQPTASSLRAAVMDLLSTAPERAQARAWAKRLETFSHGEWSERVLALARTSR